MTVSTASAVWEGGLKSGKGTFAAKSGAFKGPYTFATRFEGAEGTNPEELLAAAHAACFSMALSAGLEKAGTPVTRVQTTASCTMDMVDGGRKITTMRLVTRAKVAGVDQAAFLKAAEAARDGCPVSGAFKGNVKVELDATLEGRRSSCPKRFIAPIAPSRSPGVRGMWACTRRGNSGSSATVRSAGRK